MKMSLEDNTQSSVVTDFSVTMDASMNNYYTVHTVLCPKMLLLFN